MTRFLVVGLVASLFLAACRSAPKTLVGLPLQLRPENEGTTGKLSVHITGIPSVRGTIFIELYDRDTYFDFSRVPNEQVVPVTATAMTVTLEHVPAGRYIVVGSNDANGNNELDTGFLGVPVEAYGFSRGARGAFGPPDFEAGAFDFDGTSATVEVLLR